MTTIDAGEPVVFRPSGVRHHVRAFTRTYPAGAIGALLLLTFIGLAAAASFVNSAAYSTELVERLQPPSWTGGSADHLLGTDSLGRDVAARILIAIRISLLVAAASVLAAGSGIACQRPNVVG